MTDDSPSYKMTPQELRKETVALAQFFKDRNINARDSIIVMASMIPFSLRAVLHDSDKTMEEGGKVVAQLIMENVKNSDREKNPNLQ